MRCSRPLVLVATISAVAMLGIFSLQHTPRAQSDAPQAYAGPNVTVGGEVSSSGAVERSPAAIDADAALAPSGASPAFAAERRPTMPRPQYDALKAAANAQAPMSTLARADAATPSAETPTLGAVNFLGAKEGAVGANSYPSDDDADVSSAQIAQITNSSLWVFNKAGTLLATRSLNALLGTADFVGDVQVLFDSTWRRWVLTADDFTLPPSSFGYLWLAVSQTNSATGGWFVYRISFGGGVFASPNFLDFPHLGMDQDALLFTSNIFSNANGQYMGTTAFAIAKARAYNGLGFSFPAFTPGLIGTLMPPVQLGAPWYSQYPLDYFAVADPTSGVNLYTMINAGKSVPFLTGPVHISGTAAFNMPASAVQPGCINTIDTLDGRFQNACYQVPPFSSFPNGLLYCVHTVGPHPTPLWYALNPSTNSVASAGFFSRSGTSDDFNPAIAADAAGNIFVTETATDPTGAVKPQVLFGGAVAGNPVTLSSTPAAGSSVCLSANVTSKTDSTQRWGDYSAARFDPATSISGTPGHIIGWITNQKVVGASAWGTKIAKVRQ
jgi:hypothetical protein